MKRAEEATFRKEKQAAGQLEIGTAPCEIQSVFCFLGKTHE